MTNLTKPSRRTLMKWGVASAGLPLVSQALSSVAHGKPEPAAAEDSSERGGSTVILRPGLQIYFKDEWFGAPWLESEPVVFLHGNLETGAVWFGWVPRMAQKFRVLVPDLPGFGRSTAPADFEWTMGNFAKITADYLDALGIESAHIIGAKTGGAIAMQFAATYPKRTRSVVVASGPFTAVDPRAENNSQQVRLGSAATREEIAYFDKMRDDTRPETRRGMGKVIASINLDGLLPQIAAPTLIITSDRSALQTVETVLRYQPKIPNSRLLVVTSDAYHVAVANADECVTSVLEFIEGTTHPATSAPAKPAA
jgi:3-oxoadipate enol-lactonase